MKLKYVAWIIGETKEDENTKQDKITEETSFISMPTEQSLFEEIEVNEEKHELVQKYLQNKFSFAGNLRLSASGKSYNLYRGDVDTKMEEIEVEKDFLTKLAKVSEVPF
tara:strand:+ start:49 stop:375 length:327 start_codon:yes stop_codon:yes gene_type:complete